MLQNSAQDNRLGSHLTVLVVDPNPGVRANLVNMLNQSGVSRIDHAVNAGTAVKQLARKTYDIVLCEVDLGGAGNAGGQDGQQLLEDLRHHRIIPPWAIFIMLTSEGARDKVTSAAELTPTDYILKPFTSGLLAERLARALARRAVLLPAYQQVAQGNPAAAIGTLQEAARAHPRHALDCARLQAELHASLKEHARAEAVYRGVLAAAPPGRAPGWTRLGLARTLAAQERLDEARALLEELVADNPQLMAAYDLLAQCMAARGEHTEALKTLEQAVAISPHVVRRLRTLGAVALEAGDAAAAERSFRQVVTRSRHSEFRDPEDHVNLVRALVTKGDAPGAAGVVRDLERSLRGTPQADACRALSRALVQGASGNGAAAVAELKTAVDAVRAGAALSPPLRVDLARTCLANTLDEEASEVMRGALAGAGGITLDQADQVFVDAGRPDMVAGMHKQLRAQAQVLLGVADEKRNMGDVRGAVQTLLDALAIAPGNLQVLTAVCGGILRQVMEMGWDHVLAAVCAEQLEHIRRLDPAHPRLAAMDAEFAAARRKYGIAQ